MQAEAQTTEPTAAEMDAAVDFTTDAEGVDHAAVAVKAVAAAETPSDAPRLSRADRVFRQEMDGLKLRAMTARSPTLRRLILKGIEAKKAAEDGWEPYAQADEHTRDLRKADASASEIAAAEAAYDTAWKAWEALRRVVEDVAEEVAEAPFADLRDVICRAEAAALLLGTTGSDDLLPETDEDREVVLLSYRSAISEMIAHVPDRDAWDDAVSALRQTERDLAQASRNYEATGEDADFAHRSKLAAIIDGHFADRDRFRTLILSLDPPDIDGLLDMMDVVFDHGALVDVSTYERRAFVIGKRAVTEEEQWSNADDFRRRAFALVAHHAARLRDQSKPRDWQEAMRDIGGLHPNAKDAVHRAFTAGMDLADLKNIQLAGQPETNLPTLLFAGQGGQFWIRPDSVWKGHIFHREDGSEIKDGAFVA